jgi:TorA maturation chaperone TorD
MAILLQKMMEEPEKRTYYTKLAKRFLVEHLTKWIPQFTSDLEEGTTSPFYKTLARATREFIVGQPNSLDKGIGDLLTENSHAFS